MSISRLSWEVISNIAFRLDVDDFFHLALSCRTLHGLIHDNNVCKRVLQSAAPSAVETRSAYGTKGYARALRTLFKRRNAISSASPFSVAMIAKADSYFYSSGVLCYISNGMLRIWHLHNSANTEHVIDIGKLLNSDREISRIHNARQDYDFQILHYADEWTSCWYLPKDSSPGWLVIINPSQGCRVYSHQLTSSRKIFVRNDKNYLYYGTHSDIAENETHRWALRGCNLENGSWHSYLTHLPEMIGSEIGVNICFEIFDGFLYGLSNTDFETEEITWISYYTCTCFPVNQVGLKSFQLGATKKLWRRSHYEGPIDNPWNFITLTKNERNGPLTIVEGRREWRAGSRASRTYYTTELSSSDGPSELGGSIESISTNNSGSSTASSTNTHSPNRQDECGHDDEGENNTKAPASRSAHLVHPGDNAATSPLLSLNNSLLRCYHLSCQAYLDLVDLPLPEDPDSKCQIRLRIGSRRLRSHAEHAPLATAENPFYPEQQMNQLYKPVDIQFWPPAHWRNDCQNFRDLHDILGTSPDKYNFTGVWDQSSVCYSTGGPTKTVVFISFDPSICLPGTRPFTRQKEETQPGQQASAVNAAALQSNGIDLKLDGSREQRSGIDNVKNASLASEDIITKAPLSNINDKSERPKWASEQAVSAGAVTGFHFFS